MIAGGAKKSFTGTTNLTLQPHKKSKEDKKPMYCSLSRGYLFPSTDEKRTPVKTSGHFKSWQKQGLWRRDRRYMSAHRNAHTHVPLAAFSTSCLARLFASKDLQCSGSCNMTRARYSRSARSVSVCLWCRDKSWPTRFYATSQKTKFGHLTSIIIVRSDSGMFHVHLPT